MNYDTMLNALNAAITTAVQSLYGCEQVPELKFDRPPKPELGDLALPCFVFARVARKKPILIAQELKAKLEEDVNFEKLVEESTLAGPYLNIKFRASTLFASIVGSVEREQQSYGHSQDNAGQQVMVEFSSPNTNKPLHLGHIRNNALGDSTCNLLKAVGYDVVRANLVNDRGVHICKSMLAYQKWGGSDTPESTGIKGDHFVGSYYVKFSQALKAQQKEIRESVAAETGLKGAELDAWLETNAPLAKEAQNMLLQWEEGNPEVRALWKMMNSWVFSGFDISYKRMGITFDKFYLESQNYTRGRSVIMEALKKGLVYQKEDGSTWIDLRDEGLDEKILLRRDGTSLYFTQDIGTAIIKNEDYDLTRSIIVVATEQDHHFRLLFAALEKMGYSWAKGLYHLSYGMVNLPDGKMKSREGTVVDADDLLDQLQAACVEKAQATQAQGSLADRDLAQLKQTASEVSLGALKFFILKVNPRKEMIFNPQESINLQGDTGPYVQYAHARLRSMLAKGKAVDLLPTQGTDLQVLGNVDERNVATLIAKFPSVVRDSAEKLAPSMVTSYLLDLAGASNKFYNQNPVLKADKALACERLALCQAAAITLENGLSLLGIPAPKAM